MVEIYKIATLKVSGMSSSMRMKMLQDFLHKQEIDILLLQEVTQHDVDIIRGYNAHVNVGTHRRGTTMLTREQISLTNITRLTSGRGMAPSYRGVWLVNICGLSTKFANSPR